MTSSPAASDRSCTALEVVADCIARLRRSDPRDTAGVLLAAWHGFAAAQAAGRLLAARGSDDAVLAGNAVPVFAAVAAHLYEAPSLPYVDQGGPLIDGLVPAAEESGAAVESATDAVRQGIIALAMELNSLLPRAAEHAVLPGDRVACRHGTRLASGLSCCWEGRLSTFLNDARGDSIFTGDSPTRRRRARPRR